MLNGELSEVVTESFRPVVERYQQNIKATVQEIIEAHSGHLRPEVETPSQCDDCRQWVSDSAGNTEWSIYTRNAYLVMIISGNRDAWKDISSDIDSFGEDFDACMTSCAAIAIAADIADELERLG